MKGQKKPFLIVLLLLLMLAACEKTERNVRAWAWISGSNAAFPTGVYGTKGVPSPSNVPGGRRGAVSWKDSDGRFWLFGGDGLDSGGYMGPLNDLWTFDSASGQWTWVSGSEFRHEPGTYGTQGIPDPTNVPGAKTSAVAWCDPNGHVWLFGGGGSLGVLNDLWKYDPISGLWTWISGSDDPYRTGIYGTKGTPDRQSVPGARAGSVSWVGSQGKLWLFGGVGYGAIGSGCLNDLWSFDPSTLEWTWVSGSPTHSQSGVYGTKRFPAPSNVPGGRWNSFSWLDPSGKLWLFGGFGLDSAGDSDYLNDLWSFDPTTLEWTWVSGSDSIDQVGDYGTRGRASPGSREAGASWIDPQGRLWLFGGSGLDAGGYRDQLMDLWKFDPEKLLWTWESGSDMGDQVGVYGTKGTADGANYPGARFAPVSWIDLDGRLWLFGGFGFPMSGQNGYLNDLWRYDR